MAPPAATGSHQVNKNILLFYWTAERQNQSGTCWAGGGCRVGCVSSGAGWLHSDLGVSISLGCSLPH